MPSGRGLNVLKTYRSVVIRVLEYTVTRLTIWVLPIDVVLSTGMVRDEATVADLAFPIDSYMCCTRLHMLIIAIPCVERPLAIVAVHVGISESLESSCFRDWSPRCQRNTYGEPLRYCQGQASLIGTTKSTYPYPCVYEK